MRNIPVPCGFIETTKAWYVYYQKRLGYCESTSAVERLQGFSPSV